MEQTFIDSVMERQEDPKLSAKKAILSITQIAKQELIIIGYIRKNKENILYLKDFILLLKAYSKWYSNPVLDPANFISNDEITKSNIYRLKGNHLFKHKQYQDAIIKYNTALMFNRNDDKTFCNRSLCYLLLNDTLSANKDAYTAIRMRPTNHKCWYRLAVAAEALNDVTTAYIACETTKTILKMMNNQNRNVDNRFSILKQKLNRRDKLWIKHFNKYEIQQTFILKLQKFLKMTNLTQKELTSNRNWKIYMTLFMTLFRLRQQSDVIKYTLGQIPFTNITTHPSWHWGVSYTTIEDIIEGINKRLFNITIVSQPTGLIENIGDHTFGKPKAKRIIYSILKTIFHPFLYSYSYKPLYITLAYRLKDEANEIINTLIDFGIHCVLQSKECEIMECHHHNTNVYGFNYIKNREQLIAKTRCCGNKKCKMTKQKLRRKYHTEFKLCSGCKSISYCSRRCQKYDWKYWHRDLCPF